MIEFKKVTKTFGKVAAVESASFTVPSGRIAALIGANGSGKTTTMRMISTVLTPDEGTVLVNGIDVHKNVEAARRQIGLMLGGDAALLKRFSARENIEYYGVMQGMTKDDIKARTEYLIKMLNMEAYADKRVENFSRGMRQKVLLAQTLIHNPPVLLLDEPSTGLDIYAAIEIQNVIKKSCEESKTVIISSHNMSEIEKLCDYAIIIDHGRVLYSGNISELKNQFDTDSIEKAFVCLTGDRNAASCNY